MREVTITLTDDEAYDVCRIATLTLERNSYGENHKNDPLYRVREKIRLAQNEAIARNFFDEAARPVK